MSITSPKVGAQYKLDHQIYEVVSINENMIAMCSLVHQYRRFIEREEFAIMEQKGKLVLHHRAPVDISPAARLASMSEAKRHMVHYRGACVNACLDQLGGRLPREQAQTMIKQVSKKIGDENPPSVSTVWRWKRMYLRNDLNLLSLLRQAPRPRRKRMAVPAEELMKHYIETVYLQRERPSLTHAYKLLKGHVIKENFERQRYEAERLVMPSYATFRRRVLAMDRYYVTQKREGTKAAKKMNKFSGHLFIEDDPYSFTIFDSHYLNVMVIDERTGIVGRPLLSAHIVPATREHPGWDISLGPPCAEKMMRATIRAIITNGKMAGIGGDHGIEIYNNWTITTFKTLGIDPDFVPVGDPDGKAIMERYFGTVCTGFSNNLSGTTKGSPDACGDYPSAQRACMTLEQLRTAYAAWVNIYEATWHSELWTSPALKKEQLSASALPAERYTEEELNALCVSRWYLRLNGGRVESRHLSWYGPGLPEVRQKLKRKQQAIVYFNPCDLGTVWVAHPDTPDDRHPAVATEPKYQNGLTLSDHELVVQQMLNDKRTFNADAALIALYELNEYVEACKQANKPKAKTRHPHAPAIPVLNDQISENWQSTAHLNNGSLDHSDLGTLYVRDEDDHDTSR